VAKQRKASSSEAAAANDTARLEAFSDGVFAIAITLLILEIDIGGGEGALTERLLRAWPSYLAYVLSFVMIGVMWANHHAIFRLIERTTHGLLVTNLLLLMMVAFLPFPTNVLADNIRAGADIAFADRRAAAVFYSATFVGISIFFNVMWQVASRGNRLIHKGAEDAAAEITKGYQYGVPMYLATTLVALWNPTISVILVGFIAIYFLLPRGRAD
jgi:uncharacterized membrane protein